MAAPLKLKLRKAIQDLVKHPKDLLEVNLINDRITYWKVLILGPKDSAYANGVFNFCVYFARKCFMHVNTYPLNIKIAMIMKVQKTLIMITI